MVGQGRPLLVAARNSDSRSRGGCIATAADAHDALIDLARKTGFDATACLPPREDLAEWLFQSQNVQHFVEESGRPFSLRTCLVDLSEHGLVVSLSAGSARKLTDKHEQPHVLLIQRVLREAGVDFTGIFVKRFDRLSRSTSPVTLHELRSLTKRLGSSWSGDGDQGRWDLGDMAELIQTYKGMAGRSEAHTLRTKSAFGMDRETHRHMSGGRVRYAISGPVPPGLMRYRDRVSDRSILAIDSPSFYPVKHEAKFGVPDVRDDSGGLVDQAATVSWVLRNFARDGRDEHDLLPELLRRRFSTAGLRSRTDQGPAAYWGGPSKPVHRSWTRRWFEPFEAYLELYESGRLAWRSEGETPEETVDVAVSGVFPEDGAWADPEDFDRIREFLRQRRAKGRLQYSSWAWSGFPATLDGQSVSLRPSPERDPLSGSFRWILSGDRAAPAATPRVHRAIGDDALTAAIVDGLVAWNGRPLLRFLEASRVRDQVALLREERAALITDIESVERGQRHRHDLIFEVDGADQFVMPSSLRARAYDEYEERESRLRAKAQELARLDRELASASGQFAGLDVEAMANLINGLRDPAASQVKSALREGVRNLTFTSRPVQDGRHLGTEIRIEGDLVFATQDGAFHATFTGSQIQGPAASARQRRLREFGLLRSGHTADLPYDNGVRMDPRDLRLLFDDPPARLSAVHCADPALLRLSMATLFPDAIAGEDPEQVPRLESLVADIDLRADFGDVSALSDNIAEHYARSSSSGWLRVTGGRYVTDFLIATARDSRRYGCEVPDRAVPSTQRREVDALRSVLRTAGRLDAWRWSGRATLPRPRPCRHCGGLVLAPLCIPEPRGYVCLAPGCRRDESGVRWPTRFDCFVTHADRWVSAGFDLELPKGRLDVGGVDRSSQAEAPTRALSGAYASGTRHPRAPRARTRIPLVDTVSSESRAAMVSAYRDPSQSVRAIVEAFGTTTATFYAVLRAEGVPRTRRRRLPAP